MRTLQCPGRNIVWAVVLCLWIVPLSAMIAAYDSHRQGQESTFSIILFWVLAGWLSYAWLRTAQQIVLPLCCSVARSERDTSSMSEHLPVAILYTTKNDFSERAVLSCVQQEYPRFHVFILDDSTDPSFQLLVD